MSYQTIINGRTFLRRITKQDYLDFYKITKFNASDRVTSIAVLLLNIEDLLVKKYDDHIFDYTTDWHDWFQSLSNTIGNSVHLLTWKSFEHDNEFYLSFEAGSKTGSVVTMSYVTRIESQYDESFSKEYDKTQFISIIDLEDISKLSTEFRQAAQSIFLVSQQKTLKVVLNDYTKLKTKHDNVQSFFREIIK